MQPIPTASLHHLSDVATPTASAHNPHSFSGRTYPCPVVVLAPGRAQCKGRRRAVVAYLKILHSCRIHFDYLGPHSVHGLALSCPSVCRPFGRLTGVSLGLPTETRGVEAVSAYLKAF